MVKHCGENRYLPTAGDFVRRTKDMYYGGKTFKDLNPRHFRDFSTTRKKINNTTLYRSNIEKEPAGFPDFGPQHPPHVVPQQKSLYFYKR